MEEGESREGIQEDGTACVEAWRHDKSVEDLKNNKPLDWLEGTWEWEEVSPHRLVDTRASTKLILKKRNYIRESDQSLILERALR